MMYKLDGLYNNVITFEKYHIAQMFKKKSLKNLNNN
jgi:hypothetical protein